MFWLFLLQFINSFVCFSGAEHETLCTSNACFTLHADKLRFQQARQNCVNNGGSLMTIRGRDEEHALSLLLSQFHRHLQDNGVKIWIGLKLPTANCVSENKPLRGFKWVSGEEDSEYSNWKEEPAITCMDKCVWVNYTLSGQNQLKWNAGSCKQRSFYACKFYFKGMCHPLVRMGPGQINYTLPFSKKPERSKLKFFPYGTFADIVCGDKKLYYSMCKEERDTYGWLDPGPFCKPKNQNCMISNGGCQHECHQDADEVRCVCRDGYDLGDDGLSCSIKDLCHVATCEHQCVNGESGYFCQCSHGYRLDENKRNCSDVDECQSETCGGHLCVNTQGSYKCECKHGYRMARGKCTDVNECSQTGCQHGCTNSVGSFTCYCNEGFALADDGYSCVDINECDNDPCEFTCVNTVGSFNCTCPPDSNLEADGTSCTSYMTETSTVSSGDPGDEDENFTVSLISSRTIVEPPQTEAPLPELVTVTHGERQSNASLSTSPAFTANSRVLICVLGSVIPLLVLITVTLAIAIIRCSRSKKEAKKNTTTDGYCWVSSGLDPRLEKLYESILTDDL